MRRLRTFKSGSAGLRVDSHSGQHDPQHVLIETENGVLADVEIFVNAQFGYQVATQAVFEEGVVNIGEDTGPYVRSAGRWGAGYPDFRRAIWKRL